MLTSWRHQTFSTLLFVCAGNSPVTGEFPSQRPVMRSFDVFFDLHLNKRLSKQSRRWWFGTPSRPLWRHCNDLWPWVLCQRNENKNDANDSNNNKSTVWWPHYISRPCVLMWYDTKSTECGVWGCCKTCFVPSRIFQTIGDKYREMSTFGWRTCRDTAREIPRGDLTHSTHQQGCAENYPRLCRLNRHWDALFSLFSMVLPMGLFV